VERRPLACGEWLATHRCVDGIEDSQAIDIHPRIIKGT
jgi:hypothetical protein